MKTHFPPGAAVLLLNSGGPGNPDEVEPFLRRLFADPHMIQLPAGRFYQTALARWMARRRTPASRLRYQVIGNASPVLPETRDLARWLSTRLSVPVACAMRYSAPGVEAALQTLAAQQAQRIVAVSLYPHYSFTTSLSALEQVEQHLPDTMAWTPVKAFGTHPGWIRALTEALTARWHELRPGLSARVVFTAHSLPLRYLRRGDPYVAQVRATVASVQQAMPLPLHCLLAFQSQVGPLAWQGPSLEKILAAMVRDKVRQVIVCPVSFVTENLETLYDLDVVFQQQCLRAGLKHFFRVTTVGASETFRIALAEIIQAAAAPWQGLKSKTVRSRTQRRPPCLM